MTSASARHIPELDGLRGLLSWWVVVDHILLQSGFDGSSLGRGLRILTHGDYAVDVFIILSGFVIYKLCRDRPEPPLIFLLRRFLRLWPVYIVCLLGSIALHPLTHFSLLHAPLTDPASHERALANWLSEQTHFTAHLAAHLPMLHGLVPDTLLPAGAVAFLGSAWSISLEWQFYLAAPLLFWLLRRGHTLAWLGFGVAAGVAWMCRYSSPLNDWSPMQAFLPQKLLLFGVGMISFEAWNLAANRGRELAAPLLCLAVLVYSFTLSLPLALWTVAIAAALAEDGLLKAALSSTPMQFLGRISYSTYLSHMLVVSVLEALAFHFVDNVTRPQMLGALLVFGIPLTLALSGVLHRWVEIPGIALGRKLRARYTKAAGPA